MSLYPVKPGLYLLALLLLVVACSRQEPEAAAPGQEREPAAINAQEVTQGAPTPVSPLDVPSPTTPPTAPSPAPSATRARAGEEHPPGTLYTPKGPPPPIDTSVASVRPRDIIFDTFNPFSRTLRLSRASAEDIERLRDRIKPIYEPRYDPVEGGNWLLDSDLVIGYAAESGAFAYPIKILNSHEIVNDFIDGEPVLVSYCPLCASAVVYSRELDGQVLLFGNTSALYESDMVMYDHQTGSYWFQVLGEAIMGPLTEKRLRMLPAVTVTWGQWKERHADTKVLSRNLGLLDGGPRAYNRDPFLGYAESVNALDFAFPVSRDKLDDRLRPGDIAFAVQVGESHRAYALTGTEDRVINDEVGGESVVVIVGKNGPTAVAFFGAADGQELTFKLEDGSIVNHETGSMWNDTGLAVSGPLSGARLTPVPARTSYWFSLVGALPDIELHSED